MSVCAHRPETPGFFQRCWPCKCGEEVLAEQDDSAPVVGVRPNDNGGRTT